MKIWVPLLFICVTVAGCVNNRFKEQLDCADSLAAVNTSQALAVLNRMDSAIANGSDEERMRWRLIKTKALVYSYHTFTSDSLIRPVVRYYEQNDKAALKGTYYYAGKTYLSLNDYPHATDFFLKALEHTPQSEVRQRGRIYCQLGYIHQRTFLSDEALKMFKRADSCFLLSKDSVSRVFVLRDIASLYIVRGECAVASRYLHEALHIANLSNIQDLKASVLTQMARMYCRMKQYDSARFYLRPALEFNDPAERVPLNLIHADIYKGLGMMDSARACYLTMVREEDVYAKASASGYLAEYYIKEHDFDKALLYQKQHAICMDSFVTISRVEAIKQKNDMYNYNLIEKENVQLKEEARLHGIFIRVFVFVLVLIVVLVVFGVKYGRERSVKLKFILETIKLQKEKSKREQSLKEVQLSRLKDSDIYVHILQLTKAQNGKKRLTDDEWALLDKTINEIFPDFCKELDKLCKMSSQDYRMCLLLKAGIQLSDIAAFLNITPSGIGSSRTKLYQRAYHIKRPAKEWDEVIASL